MALRSAKKAIGEDLVNPRQSYYAFQKGRLTPVFALFKALEFKISPKTEAKRHLSLKLDVRKGTMVSP